MKQGDFSSLKHIPSHENAYKNYWESMRLCASVALFEKFQAGKLKKS